MDYGLIAKVFRVFLECCYVVARQFRVFLLVSQKRWKRESFGIKPFGVKGTMWISGWGEVFNRLQYIHYHSKHFSLKYILLSSDFYLK